jgi:formate dehydrogenase subunit delta
VAYDTAGAPRQRRLTETEARMQGNKLVTMVNQIATFHRRLALENAATEVAAHLERFWEPRMRKAIQAHLDAGGDGLSPIAKRAVELSKARDEGRLPFDPYQAAAIAPPLEA